MRIVPEDIERIFERFYQSKKSIKYPVYGQSSTGIGLFLCKKIISLHGGNIYAGNNPKQGAFFRILLPFGARYPQAESEKEKYEQNEHPLSIPANGNEKKETILIVAKIMQICVLIFVWKAGEALTPIVGINSKKTCRKKY
ncbi:MAG: sensor histidine kinase [Phocaeicola vulgatus]